MAFNDSPFPKYESPAMDGWTTAEMWGSITNLARFSHSITSHTQIEMAHVWEVTRRFGPGATEIPTQLVVTPTIEQETGRLINDPV